MTKKPSKPDIAAAGQSAAHERAARLKAALKANLQRRKAQAKTRGTETKSE